MNSEPIRFSLSLYREDALETSINAYSGLAQFRTERQGQDVLVFLETEHSEHYQHSQIACSLIYLPSK